MSLNAERRAPVVAIGWLAIVERQGLEIVPERFVDEPISPVVATFDPARMAIGEPGLPGEFLWRGRSFTVAALMRTWKETGRCRHGSPEMYVRKHWFEILTTSNATMKIYFDRQPRRGLKGPRWWLLSIRDAEEDPAGN